MQTSTEFQTVISALAIAVAAMSDPKKNAKNDHFKNRYADLSAVLECIESPLASNGLLMTQTTQMFSDDLCVLVTRLWHIESGEWLETVYPLKPAKNDPQGLGGALTYARRYALKALFGMVDVDDDGETASGRGAQQRQAPAKVDGFDSLEHAIEASSKVTDRRLLQAWAVKVAASKFTGSDKDRATAIYRQMQTELMQPGADRE